jgi:hypothetical protein
MIAIRQVSFKKQVVMNDERHLNVNFFVMGLVDVRRHRVGEGWEDIKIMHF